MTIGDTMKETGDTTTASSTEEVLPRCYFDVEIGGISAGRIVFELFSNAAPKSAENFRSLCTGDSGIGKTTEKPLHYKGTVFHRVIKDFMIQGGDFSKHNGTGGESIYGGTFEDESFEKKHDAPYLLSMANRGKDTNGSQFFILTQAAPHLDGVHVVFGRTIFGQAIIKQIEGLPVDRKSRPLQDVRIADCGELVLVKKKKKEKKPKKEKKKRTSDSEKSSGELTDSDDDSNKRKKHDKSDFSDTDEEKSSEVFCTVKEGEVPAIPENRFLMRGVPKDKEEEKNTEDKKKPNKRDRSRSRSRNRSRSRSHSRGRDRRDKDRRSGNRNEKDTTRYGRGGRINDDKKVKGRGRVCYRPVSKSRSRSKTPPHWRAEARRVISMKEYEEKEKQKRQREEEIRRRQEERQKRHEEQDKQKTPTSVSENILDETTKDIILAPDVSEADKAVEELTAQIQMAAATNEGVVYYQHLYKNRRLSDKTENEPIKSSGESEDLQGIDAPSNFPAESVKDDTNNGRAKDETLISESQLSKEDEEEELRLRRELLRKRMKDWEDSSTDDEHPHEKRTQIEKKTQREKVSSGVVGETRRESKDDEKRQTSREDKDNKEARNSRKNSRSRSKSRSRSRSGGRTRRREVSKRRGRSKSRSRSRDRRKSRSRSKEYSRHSGYRRNRKSRSRSRDRRR